MPKLRRAERQRHNAAVLLEALLAQLLSTAPPASPAANAPSCPADMVPVVGVHHEYVQRLCLDFAIGKCFSFLPGFIAREGRVTPVRTCMDRYEWPNEKGKVPAVMMSFVEAERLCAGVGKRLCTEFEWEAACEGPRTLPFPYGQRVDDGTCNSAKPYRPVSEAKLASRDPRVREAETRRLWQGEPSGSYPKCVSPHGVVDMVGNIEEWVRTSRPEWPFKSALKGGYWSKRWAGCRGTNDSHGPEFRFYEVGLRCCRDPQR
jgi:formylglycine-generating enzyme required for sulfatase activity